MTGDSSLIDHVDFVDGEKLTSYSNNGSVFKFCTLNKFSVDGQEIDATFLFCEAIGLNWYWGLFNGCVFVDTKFKDCVFQGSNFADCRFLNCEFTNCRFELDNLGSPCSFTGSKWFECNAIGCKGLPESVFPSF